MGGLALGHTAKVWPTFPQERQWTLVDFLDTVGQEPLLDNVSTTTIGSMAVNCCLGEMDQIAMRLELPLNLRDHHIGSVPVLFLLLLPLNRDKGGGAWMGLVVNGEQFFVVLLFDLLLVRRF